MQKLRYENLLGQSILFSDALPYILEKIDGLGLCANTVISVSGMGTDVTPVMGMKKAPRVIDISFHLIASNRAELYHLRREVCGLLSKDKAYDGQGVARLIYENDAGAWWVNAVPEGEVRFERRMKDLYMSVNASFRCESPYFFSMLKKRQVLSFSGDGFELPMKYPIAFGSRDFKKTLENLGQVPTPVSLEIIGQGETPMLLNHSTGAKIGLLRPLPQGHTLFISTDPAALAARVADERGIEQNAFGYLSPDTSLAAFFLRAGLNEIEYLPGGSSAMSRITVQWYERFEGV